MTSALGGTAAVALVASAFVAPVSAQDSVKLVMAAPDWPPTRFLQEYANANYVSPSGRNVTVELDFIPWPTFYERVAASLTSGEQKYNMVITDSQWLGAFIEGGYYREMTQEILADPELSALVADLHPALVSAYSAYPYLTPDQIREHPFPHPDAHYYGFPQFPDTYITYYRTDLFCNEEEGAAFQEEYGYNLPCTYEDWEDVDWDKYADIGEFFQRSAGETLAGETLTEDFAGIGYQAGKGYDFSSMAINAFIWQYGGSIWNESGQPCAQAEGVVNSDIAVEAFEHYLDLLQYMPAAVHTGQMDIFVLNDLYAQGKVASEINWVGLGAPVMDPATSKVSEVSGFAPAPGLRLDDGSISRFGNQGGQPFVVTTWSTDVEIEEAVNFIKFWLSDDVQWAFTAAGGQSGRVSIMQKDGYNDLGPFNRAHVEMMEWQRDVWHIPEFFELLTYQQDQFDRAITGQIGAKEALDLVAAQQQEVLSEAGRIVAPDSAECN
ncbi:MAG: ABC transporter substrate-binding protein [Alphaproteobacteria bacterium]